MQQPEGIRERSLGVNRDAGLHQAQLLECPLRLDWRVRHYVRAIITESDTIGRENYTRLGKRAEWRAKKEIKSD